MPVIPSEVGGVEPGGLAVDGGAGKRLRELCEVLLTARAKMLGFSRQMSHELSSIPPHLKSSIVNGLMEIVSHLNKFEIQLGDTRLTGKVRLGEDAGMAQHFPGESRFSGEPPFDQHPRPALRGVAHRELGHVPLGPRMRLATSHHDPVSPLRRRKTDAIRARRRAQDEEEASDHSTGRKDDRVGEEETPYDALWVVARRRRRKGTTRHELDRLEHAMLCWVCLALLQDEAPARPSASYEQREEALQSLERKGYARRAGKGWRPTPAGFEASGLVGVDGQLEVDP